MSTVLLARTTQVTARMAAIFALVLLPALAAVGFLLKTSEGASLGVVLAKLCFVALATGLFYGLLRMARGWDGETS